MFKEKMLKEQRLYFTVLNFIAFTVIFAIFGLIIFGQVKSTLFTKTDQTLLEHKELTLRFQPSRDMPDPNRPNERDKIRNGAPPSVMSPFVPASPRIIFIQWDQNGTIVNREQIGMPFYENFIQDLKFDVDALDQIKQIKINEHYFYRSITYLNDGLGDDVYATQLLINVDAEQTIINNFKNIIMICVGIFILLSMTASLLLSKRTMKPIIQSWNKQSEFVENASHELRTPLTIIQNKLEMLLTSPHKRIEDVVEPIAITLAETRRLTDLTKDLLTLARVDSAETQLLKKEIDLDSFIEYVCGPFIEIAESQDKQLWLRLSANRTIKADPDRLHQLLIILLDNALKYTSEQDSIAVVTAIEHNKVIIEVSDSGIGINESNVTHIFDRFYREDQARSRERGGVGLGLSIAKWIVESHQGTISAMRNKPKGTTIQIRLPK